MSAVFGFDEVAYHANMLLDSVRVDAFARAIAEVVRAQDVVVDVGAGSGVLSILAAKAGARVYAVERGPLATIIDDAARDNGVADRITVIRGDVRDTNFPEPPTVIVSETIGSFGFDEDIAALIAQVRPRCAPACRVIPESVDVEIALCDLTDLHKELADLDNAPVRLRALRTALASRVMPVFIDREHVVSSVASARANIGREPTPIVRGRVTVSRDAKLNAVAAWFSAQLSPSVTLSSSPLLPRERRALSWANLVFPLDPALAVRENDVVEVEVVPRLITDRGTWSWSAQSPTDIRRGDAMSSIVGNRTDLLAQLGLRLDSDPTATELLPQWSAALAGGPATTHDMAERLRAAYPGRYVDNDDAANEVRRMVYAAERAT